MAPPFSVGGGTTVNHGSVQLVDILRDVPTSSDMLREELIFSDTQLPGRHEVEGVSAFTRLWKGVRGQVGWEVS